MKQVIYKDLLSYQIVFKSKLREPILITKCEREAISKALQRGVRKITVWEAGGESFELDEIEIIRPLGKSEKARLAKERWYYRRNKFLWEEKRQEEVGKVYLFELVEVRETEESMSEKIVCRKEVWQGPRGEYIPLPKMEFIF